METPASCCPVPAPGDPARACLRSGLGQVLLQAPSPGCPRSWELFAAGASRDATTNFFLHNHVHLNHIKPTRTLLETSLSLLESRFLGENCPPCHPCLVSSLTLQLVAKHLQTAVHRCCPLQSVRNSSVASKPCFLF